MNNESKLKKIVEAIFKVTGIDLKTAKGRKAKIADAKKIYFYIALRKAEMTLQDSAKYIGMDHSSAVHNNKKCADFLETDKIFKDIFDKVLKKIVFIYTKKELRDIAAETLRDYRALKLQILYYDEVERLKAEIDKSSKELEGIENNYKKAS